MPRTATIGPAVYERVNELVGEGKNRTEAFQVVASERSMNQGTANYYRTARSKGTTGRTVGLMGAPSPRCARCAAPHELAGPPASSC